MGAPVVHFEIMGGAILAPTEVPGGPKLAMFTDPAGNVTGLLLGKAR
jgi:predicted enzyme related to lactoylglutathione lyase